jgi:hypothetical protein
MSEQSEKLREQARVALELAGMFASHDASRILRILAEEYRSEAEKINRAESSDTQKR